MSKRIVVISGKDRTGKSTAGIILMKMDYEVVECGSIVRASMSGIDTTSLSAYYQENMSKLNSLIVNEILRRKELSKKRKLAIIGVRSVDLLARIKEEFWPIWVIYLEASSYVRYARHVNTRLLSQRISYEQFLANDAMQVRWGVEEIKKSANTLINNESTFEDLSTGITESLSNE
jgi:cytidylate kinase